MALKTHKLIQEVALSIQSVYIDKNRDSYSMARHPALDEMQLP